MNIFKSKIKINFFDCDPAGILFYANIFKIAHSVYEEFIIPTGIFSGDSECIYPIIRSGAEYKKPINFHEILTVELSVKEIRNSSFTIFYEFKDSNNSVMALAETVHVCVKKDGFTKTKLSSNLIKYLKNHLGNRKQSLS